MTVLCLGIDDGGRIPRHLLEQVAVPADEMETVLGALHRAPGVDSIAVLSTCARTELYVSSDDPETAHATLRRWFLGRVGRGDRELLGPWLRRRDELAAAGQLLTVAAGLRSPVIGDPDVAHQVRRAWRATEQARVGSAELGLLFRHAIAASRRVHEETGLDLERPSIPAVTARLLADHLPTHPGATVLVVGAGAMGTMVAAELQLVGAPLLVIANRTAKRARELADRFGGHAIGVDEIAALLPAVDAVCVAVGAGAPVLDGAMARAAMVRRPARPLVCVDLGVPRGVAADVRAVPGIRCLGIDDIRRASAGDADPAVIERAETIIDDELDRYGAATRCRFAAPALAAVHAWGEDVRRSELARLEQLLASQHPDVRRAVEQLTRRLVGRSLQPLTECIREAVATQHSEWLADRAHELVTGQKMSPTTDMATSP